VVESVYSAVRTDSLYKVDTVSSLNLNTGIFRQQKFADFGCVVLRIFILVASVGRVVVCEASYYIQNYRKKKQFEGRYIAYFAFALKCLATQEYYFLASRNVTAQAHSTLSEAAQIYAYRRPCDGILSGQSITHPNVSRFPVYCEGTT
jgi:hypothetical protein